MKFLLVVGLLTAACGAPNAGDPDGRRDQAKPMPLNKVFSDSITWDGEDRADWKIFYVEAPGLLYVTVAFDRPEGSCAVVLRDRFGAHMAREVQSNHPKIELARRVTPGRFFVWVSAPDEYCASQYSIEARLDPD